MDMTIGEFKLLANSCWQTNFQPLTIDMKKDKWAGRYRLGLDSIFVQRLIHFEIINECLPKCN